MKTWKIEKGLLFCSKMILELLWYGIMSNALYEICMRWHDTLKERLS
jgi:hypothetical protein